MRLRNASQNPLHAFRHPQGIRGALQNSRLHARVRNALPDVAHEHVHHQLRTLQHGSRSTEMKVKRNLVVGVDSGRHDNVHRRPRRHARDAGNVAAEANHRKIHHRFDPARGEFVEPRNGFLNAPFLVTPSLRIIQHDLGGEHEDMLMHQGDAELGAVDGSANCIYHGQAI